MEVVLIVLAVIVAVTVIIFIASPSNPESRPVEKWSDATLDKMLMNYGRQKFLNVQAGKLGTDADMKNQKYYKMVEDEIARRKAIRTIAATTQVAAEVIEEHKHQGS